MIQDDLINGVYQIALAICKKRGYLNPPSWSDVRISMEAWALLYNKAKDTRRLKKHPETT